SFSIARASRCERVLAVNDVRCSFASSMRRCTLTTDCRSCARFISPVFTSKSSLRISDSASLFTVWKFCWNWWFTSMYSSTIEPNPHDMTSRNAIVKISNFLLGRLAIEHPDEHELVTFDVHDIADARTRGFRQRFRVQRQRDPLDWTHPDAVGRLLDEHDPFGQCGGAMAFGDGGATDEQARADRAGAAAVQHMRRETQVRRRWRRAGCLGCSGPR